MKFPGIKKKAKECLLKGAILPTKHFRERMRERHIEISDIKHIINTGKIVGHERDIKTGNWKHTFSGQTLDSDLLNVVIALTDEGIELITCWRD